MSDPALEAPENDEVEASRAPLLDHLIELRSRLIHGITAILLAFLICFFFAVPIYNFLLAPFQHAAEAVRSSAGGANLKLELIYTGPLEFFFAKMKLALFGGVILAFPVLAWNVYRFVAPGLYKKERNAFLPFMLASPVLFVGGMSFVYYVMLPLVMRFAFSQEQVGAAGQATIQLLPRVSEYLQLVITLMLAFGFSFQLPVVLSLMGKAGLVGAQTLRKGRKYAIVIILAFAAVFTPPDVVSQLLLGIPVYLLYEISIWSVSMIERRREEEEAQAQAED